MGDQAADRVKVDILPQGEPVDAFSAIVHKDAAYSYGNRMASRLRELIPRQQFEVPIQAAGSRIIARETIKAIARTFSPSATAVTLAEAQAAGEAEGRQEAHEDGGSCRGAAGGVRGRVVHR